MDWIALLPVNVPSSPAAGSSGSAASPSTTIASLIQSIIYGYFDHSVSVSGPANNQPLTGAGIGNPDVVAYGVLSATDVWGWVPPDTRVCFLGRTGGGVVFLDSAAMPRQPSWLPHYRLGNDTCVDIPGAGIVVLVTAQGPSAIADVADPAPQQPAPQVAGLQLSGCTLITRNILNLRAGPGTDTAVLQEIPYLTRLAASGRAGQWFSVSYGGQAGWVHGDFAQKHGECLAPSPAAEQPPMPAEGQTISDCLLITNYILNLREGPGVNYGVLHKIPYLTRLPASGRMGLWFNVVYAGRSGWVHDDYVQRQGNCV
ncbi:MAG: SH3 domain-containing protein [Chloroflexota bacterium]|nr:SH3 domain-containing protein [Chloroflexota bacterium]